MFKIILIIFLIEKIFSLNPTDLCYSSVSDLTCNLKHGYRCEKGLCSLNKEICDDYIEFQRSVIFGSLRYLIKFRKNIKICEKPKKQTNIDLNQFCQNTNDCLQIKKLILIDRPSINVIKKKSCKCQGEYKHECSRNYCANDLASCEFIKNKDTMNELIIKKCDNKKNYTFIQDISLDY